MISRPKRIGILGGGQLGLMLCKSLQALGVSVAVYDLSQDCPCASHADQFVEGSLSDPQSISRFISGLDIITFEFENIPADVLIAIEKIIAIHPSPRILHICQDRIREKNYLNSIDIPTANWSEVRTIKDLEDGIERIGTPAVLKKSSMGYDGHGQVKLQSSDSTHVKKCFDTIGSQLGILEEWIPFSQEFSLIGARDTRGNLSFWDPFVNHHENHILESTIYPGSLPSKSEQSAMSIGRKLMESLDVIGLLTIEFFLLPDGDVLVNELAPRPHNSGHITIEASQTSQFEQLARILTGQDLGSIEVIKPGAMINLLGELWLTSKGEPNWGLASTIPETFLHLYGKKTPKVGRKMGHMTSLSKKPTEALATLKTLKIHMLD